MSRSGYSDDCEHLNLWRGTVERAIKGRRGQAFLREMAAALDALPVRRLIAGELVSEAGEVCALGSVFKARGVSVTGVDNYDPGDVAQAAGIAMALAAEIEYINDEGGYHRHDTPEQRWWRVRDWVNEQLLKKV